MHFRMGHCETFDLPCHTTTSLPLPFPTTTHLLTHCTPRPSTALPPLPHLLPNSACGHHYSPLLSLPSLPTTPDPLLTVTWTPHMLSDILSLGLQFGTGLGQDRFGTGWRGTGGRMEWGRTGQHEKKPSAGLCSACTLTFPTPHTPAILPVSMLFAFAP